MWRRILLWRFVLDEQKLGESKKKPQSIKNIAISDDEDVEEKFGDQDDFVQYFRLASRTAELLLAWKQSIV